MIQYKANKYLDVFDASGVGEDGCFDKSYVEDIQESTELWFNDMCRLFGAKKPKGLKPNVLMKPSISKAQMSEWLFTAIYVLELELELEFSQQ